MELGKDPPIQLADLTQALTRRMVEIDANPGDDRYALLWDAILDEFTAVGINIHEQLLTEATRDR